MIKQAMDYILCRHRVAELDGWKDVFDHHAGARRKAAGLRLVHMIRCSAEPDYVFLLFRAEDMEKARAFVESADGKCAETIEFLSI